MNSYWIRVLWVGAVLFPMCGLALPAPMSAEDLEAASDLIVEGEVVAVECLGTSSVPDEKDVTSYRAQLKALSVTKGDSPESFYIDFDVVVLHGAPELCAWSEQEHPVGQVGSYHLEAVDGSDALYASVSWNAFEETQAGSDELPACGAEDTGETGDTGDTADTGSAAGTDDTVGTGETPDTGGTEDTAGTGDVAEDPIDTTDTTASTGPEGTGVDPAADAGGAGGSAGDSDSSGCAAAPAGSRGVPWFTGTLLLLVCWTMRRVVKPTSC